MTGEVILLPKKLRADWSDVMSLDLRLSPTTFRIAYIIGTHFGNKSGLTYVGQDRLARVSGLSIPTVKRAIADLEGMGYLIVERREVGVRSDGKKVYGGRGVANVYLPACDAAQVSMTDRDGKLADKARLFWDKSDPCNADDEAIKQVMGDLLPTSKQVMGDLVLDPQRSSFEHRKEVTHDLPTLNLPTEGNSSRVRGVGAVAGPLGAAGDAIRKRLGDGKFAAWFSKLEPHSETDDTVTLAAPTKFIRDYIVAQFDTVMLDAWQGIRPATKRVEVIVVMARKAG